MISHKVPCIINGASLYSWISKVYFNNTRPLTRTQRGVDSDLLYVAVVVGNNKVLASSTFVDCTLLRVCRSCLVTFQKSKLINYYKQLLRWISDE